MAVAPVTLIVATVRVKSSVVFSWLSMIFSQLPILFSRALTWVARTFSQMEVPLAELASLASRLSAVAMGALGPVKPAAVELLVGVSEQPPTATARQSPAAAMNARGNTTESLRDTE